MRDRATVPTTPTTLAGMICPVTTAGMPTAGDTETLLPAVRAVFEVSQSVHNSLSYFDEFTQELKCRVYFITSLPQCNTLGCRLPGRQDSMVDCVRNLDGTVVSPKFCSALPGLHTISRVCNDIACPPRYELCKLHICGTRLEA